MSKSDRRSRPRASVVGMFPFRLAGGRVEYLLLQRHAEEDLPLTWQPVYGRAKKKETALAGALRELAEETGLAPLEVWQVDRIEVFFSMRVDRPTLTAVFCCRVAEDAAVRTSEEHQDHAWLSYEAALERLLWRNQRESLRCVREDIALPFVEGRPINPFLRVSVDGHGRRSG